MLATTLLPLILALVLSGHTALAEHRTCTWRPTNNAPDTMNYQQFCTATITNYLSNFTGAVYKCSAGGIGPEFTAIADWGLILLNLLELKTPCNSDGFGFDKDGHCMSPRWAACLGDAKSNNCLWYSADDDCTWPQFFFYPNLPDKITMWYDSHAAEAATREVTKGVKRRLSVGEV